MRRTERKAKLVKHAHLLMHIPPHLKPIDKALFAAIAAEKPDAVRRALGAGADVGVRNGLNRTPLHWAATIGNEDIIGILLAAHAPLNVYDEVGATPLHDAVESGDSDSVEILAAQPGIPINAREENNRTPLHIATLEGNVAAAIALLDRGADINAVDEYLTTPLHDAARQGNLPMVRALLEHRPNRADVRARDYFGSSALDYAVASGNREVVAELLDAGAQVNEPNASNETPLLLAVRRGLLLVIEELLAQWANPNVEDNDGTPLILVAARYPDERIAVRMLQLLLSKNPLPTENLVQGISTLQSRPYVAALLIDYLRKHNILIREPDWLIRWRWFHQGIAPSWSLVLDPIARSS